MAAALARGKRGANNRACARNYLISNGLIFDGVKVGKERRKEIFIHRTKQNRTPNRKPKNKPPPKEEEAETEVEVVFKKKTSNKAPDPDAWRGIIAAQEQARKERIEKQRQARLAATNNR